MSGIFQGYANSDGRVRASAVTKVPEGSANDRGMIVAGNRVVPYLVDAGQPRVFHDGIAFDNVTGLLLVGDGTATPLNISMGGLLVDVNGAVVAEAIAPDVIHQGVGLGNDGRLAIEAEPIATFIANLHNNVASTTGPGTFTRASDGLYLGADGNWRVAPDSAPRFENDQLLMEPAITNKCENYNANPDAALTNMSVAGAAAGVLTRVYDPDLIERSGLSGICKSGYVFQMDNSAGLSDSYALVTGPADALAGHTASAFGVATVGNCFVRIGAVGDSDPFPIGGAMQRRQFSGTTVGLLNQLLVGCSPGGICRFVLTSYEQNSVASSPIITQGAAASRAADALSWASANQFFNQAQGMALATLRPGYSKADQVAVLQGILSLDSASSSNLLFMDGSFKSTDGVNTAAVTTPSFVPSDVLRLAVVYGPIGASALQVGYSLNGATWVWSTAVAYDGGFTLVSSLILARAITLPGRYSDVQLFDENKGTAWIEANYP